MDILDELVAEDYLDHSPPPFPMPPGREGVTATVIHRIADGRLVEKWSDKDVLRMLQQLGVIPSMGAH